MSNNAFRGWDRHRRLPPVDQSLTPQLVTFYLRDLVPAATFPPPEEGRGRSAGPPWLAEPEIGRLVEATMMAQHREHYDLLAWCVMPDHVHALIVPYPGRRPGNIVKSWKSFTARCANAILARDGTFWQRDYLSRLVSGPEQVARTIAQIEESPVKAGLCAAPGDWLLSSARRRDGAGGLLWPG